MGPSLVSSDLWELLHSMRDDGDPLFGAELTSLKAVADAQLADDGAYAESEAPFAEIRFARLCLAK